MQAINKKVQVLLSILLIVPFEVLIYLANDVLEALGHDNLLAIPHLLHQVGKSSNQLAVVP